MKKLLFVLGLAAAVGLTGCSKDTTNDLTPSLKPTGNHTLTASVATDETRTQLGEKGESTTPVLWTKDDAILVVDEANTTHQYILEEESDGQKSGDFTVVSGNGAKAATSITAFYPYGSTTWSDTPTMTLASKQTYAAGRTFATNMSPMYGMSDTPNAIAFHHMAGVINLQLTSLDAGDIGRKVTKIELASTDRQMAGTFNLVKDGEKYTLEASEDNPVSKTITLNCNADGGIEMTQTPSCFLFVVPAAAYAASELTFTITFNDGKEDATSTLTMSAERAIAAGEIVNIKATPLPAKFVQITAKAEEVSQGIVDALKQISEATGENKPNAIQVTVADPEAGSNALTLAIPEFQAEQQSIPVTIRMPELSDTHTATISTHTTNAPTNVSIVGAAAEETTVEQAPSIVINMPATTVSLSGTYKAINATTAANTLVIERGTKIGTLTLTKGNVEIEGYSANAVTTFVKAEDWNGTITYKISEGNDIVNMAAEINSHNGKATQTLVEADYMILKDYIFSLQNDIDMTGIAYIPMGSDASYSITASAPGFAGTFNGNKHTISNIDISGNDFKNNRSVGLFGTTYNATIKDLTVENVTIQYASKWAGGLIGDMQGGTTSNCHVKNAVLCTKPDPTQNYDFAFRLGGLIGICRSTCNISECSVDGANIKGYYSIGGLIGACNVNTCMMTIGKCSVDNIVIEHMIAGAYQNKYYDSAVLLGDCDPAKQITLTNITLGKWEIKGLVKSTETTKGWTDQTWTMFPYIGEKPSTSSVIPTLDEKALTVTPLSEVMFTSTTYNAATSVWDGTTTTALTPVGDNYAIYTAAELAWLNAQVNTGEKFTGKTFTLERNIDLNDKVWIPMGSQNHSFTVSSGTEAGFYGTFDGQDHTISNVNVNVVADAKGFFGKLQTGAILRNLTVEKISIPLNNDTNIQGKWVGGMVGLMAGDAQMDKCHVKDVTIYAPKMYRLGGLIGFINNTGKGTAASVTNCSVTKADITGGYCLAGLVGTIQKQGITISDCSVAAIALHHKEQLSWMVTPNIDTKYDATSGYCFSSSPVVGDIAANLKLVNITVGSWIITNEDSINSDFSKASWTYLPYVGEMGAGATLDNASISADTTPKYALGTQYTGAARN